MLRAAKLLGEELERRRGDQCGRTFEMRPGGAQRVQMPLAREKRVFDGVLDADDAQSAATAAGRSMRAR